MPNKATDRRQTLACDTDLLVVGGGAAGLAAAVTAARAGLRVILLEHYGFCGGAAVAGLSGTVCGLYAASDDARRSPGQLVFGFAEEFVVLLRSRGGITDPIRYGKTFTLVHDPLMWREAADHLLTQAGVNVLYHALVTATLCDGDKVEGVEAWTKQGRVRVTASSLHKRLQPRAGLLAPSCISQRPCPFADGLGVGGATRRAADDRSKWISFFVEQQIDPGEARAVRHGRLAHKPFLGRPLL
jgi:flavin-dependent dehydrogenase